jgi:hypothetical protein
MYYDDNYHPTDPNDVDNDDTSPHNKLKDFKKMNKSYHQISRNVLKNNGKSQKITIDLYSSDIFGSFIKNAETGESYNYRVGSKEEDLFFKVRHATGETTPNSVTLFYDSPVHYERHQLVTLSDNNIRKHWEKMGKL